MKISLRSCLILFLPVFIISCGTEQTPSPPETESEILNETLQNAPISWIDLQQAEHEVLILPEETIYSDFVSENDTIQFRNPTQVKQFGDYLVLMRFRSPGILVIDKDGEPVRTLDQEDGLRQPASVMSDGETLYIYDDGNKEIYLYNQEFNHIDTIPFRNAYFSQGSVAMSPAYFAYQPDEATGFRASPTDRPLLSVLPKEQPESPVFEAFPRIVPSGKHPGGYNNLLFSINNNSDIAAAYPVLPYLFIYRNFEHHQSIVLQSDRFDTFDNPSLEPFEPVMGEPVVVRSVLGHIHHMDDGDILLFSLDLLHHIEYLPDDEEYHLKNSYALIRGDTGEQIRSVTSVDVSSDDSGLIYATGDGVLFKFTLRD